METILAFFLGGLVGFFFASLFAVRRISQAREECSVCGHPSWSHYDLRESGDGCDKCIDGRCGGGYVVKHRTTMN